MSSPPIFFCLGNVRAIVGAIMIAAQVAQRVDGLASVVRELPCNMCTVDAPAATGTIRYMSRSQLM
jgi:hypothetical protein